MRANALQNNQSQIATGAQLKALSSLEAFSTETAATASSLHTSKPASSPDPFDHLR
jgi:hypothetical protein